MGRKRNLQNKNPYQLEVLRGNRWYAHYKRYLADLAFQLFEWKNLPDSVDPRYLEMSIHLYGYVSFYKDPIIGYIASQGALSGTINHYLLPTHFHASSPNYQKTFPIYHYQGDTKDGMGVVIYNNDEHIPSMETIELFASELANTHEVMNVNLNAQKTPVLIKSTGNNLLSLKQVYNQFEGNTPAIFADESFDVNSVEAIKTDAPYVVDKLNQHRDALWNQALTWMGINNANLQKKERMITDEATSNNDQILNSGSIMLKSRKEACELINELYGLNLSVDYRVQESLEEGDGEDELVHNSSENSNRKV